MRNTGLKDDGIEEPPLDSPNDRCEVSGPANAVATRERVLLVEDDHALSVGVFEHLSARGFDVTCVADGVAAIESLRADRFDVLLLDLGIPRMSGDSLLHEIQREPGISHLPVVLLTGSDPQGVERAARHGVFAVHGKPADLRHVAQSLRSAVYYG